MKNKFVLLSFLAAIISVGIASAQQYANCPMGGYGTSAMLFSWLTGILIVIALILLIFWLLNQINKNKK